MSFFVFLHYMKVLTMAIPTFCVFRIKSILNSWWFRFTTTIPHCAFSPIENLCKRIKVGHQSDTSITVGLRLKCSHVLWILVCLYCVPNYLFKYLVLIFLLKKTFKSSFTQWSLNWIMCDDGKHHNLIFCQIIWVQSIFSSYWIVW